ncbi:asparagine synthase-related protein [Cognatiluteimonas profundi]|uniref:asparagine synthase-related protein n=1 Tax=Cognatiluteimonas profundi TaxID=2594501 RepID=UPI00131EB1F3|nr:asparagine synthase-related protein [Lysobacter profundi]
MTRETSGTLPLNAGITGATSARATLQPAPLARIGPTTPVGDSMPTGNMQIAMSPYYGKPDFASIDARSQRTKIDPVSVADLLRNAFVYPPHSIYEEVKLATFGFFPHHDMQADPEFHYRFRDAGKSSEAGKIDEDLVATYHRLLCEAVTRSCAELRTPWLLQSGGKDSTTMAIAIAETRPDTTCITYLGGPEENELASAEFVARRLGLRHEALVCEPGRAYDRYVAIAHRMPLLTADFALLSYADLATEVAANGGDGIIDGMGSDSYFGAPAQARKKFLYWLARGLRLPPAISELPLIGHNFKLCYLLGTVQMDPIERIFPGSRFTDAEVDALFGMKIASRSRERLNPFKAEICSATSHDELRVISMSISGAAAGFAKGLYTTDAMGIHAAYPLCDHDLREWVYNNVPREQMIDPVAKVNKVLVRRHIAERFGVLPYVARKGSFRFDLCGLARQRFDRVRGFAQEARDVLPGAVDWLDRNRCRLDNKYHASKFYLLAVVLPWIAGQPADDQPRP